MLVLDLPEVLVLAGTEVDLEVHTANNLNLHIILILYPNVFRSAFAKS